MTTVPSQSAFQTATTRRQVTLPEWTSAAVDHVQRVVPDWLADSASPRLAVKLGVDLVGMSVGMSTVPEVVLSSRAGLRTIAIGVVTNIVVAIATALDRDRPRPGQPFH